MAKIDSPHTTMTVTHGGGHTHVLAKEESPPWFRFKTQRIDVNASMRLAGSAGESIAGWTLGFIQLRYLATDIARYKGRVDRDGSMLLTSSSKTLCRDTDVGSTDVWYDSLSLGKPPGPMRTNRLAAGTVIPASGFLDVAAHMWDRPDRAWFAVQKNSSVATRPNNYLHHADIGIAFCTMLVAQDPAGMFVILKHFYWNVRWEQMFTLDLAGNVAAGRSIHRQLNIQRPVHSGNPRDARFIGKEFSLALPLAVTEANKESRVLMAPDWRYI